MPPLTVLIGLTLLKNSKAWYIQQVSLTHWAIKTSAAARVRVPSLPSLGTGASLTVTGSSLTGFASGVVSRPSRC